MKCKVEKGSDASWRRVGALTITLDYFGTGKTPREVRFTARKILASITAHAEILERTYTQVGDEEGPPAQAPLLSVTVRRRRRKRKKPVDAGKTTKKKAPKKDE